MHIPKQYSAVEKQIFVKSINLHCIYVIVIMYALYVCMMSLSNTNTISQSGFCEHMLPNMIIITQHWSIPIKKLLEFDDTMEEMLLT